MNIETLGDGLSRLDGHLLDIETQLRIALDANADQRAAAARALGDGIAAVQHALEALQRRVDVEIGEAYKARSSLIITTLNQIAEARATPLAETATTIPLRSKTRPMPPAWSAEDEAAA